ncbi:hypothetical protein [Scytonema sp. PCC 10023]|uniref:hypothetical protein n=1 Tax=Scytonema sp. PCC 10023 TaxID=1680591 RepID=UPI0039C6ADF0
MFINKFFQGKIANNNQYHPARFLIFSASQVDTRSSSVAFGEYQANLKLGRSTIAEGSQGDSAFAYGQCLHKTVRVSQSRVGASSLPCIDRYEQMNWQ